MTRCKKRDGEKAMLPSIVAEHAELAEGGVAPWRCAPLVWCARRLFVVSAWPSAPGLPWPLALELLTPTLAQDVSGWIVNFHSVYGRWPKLNDGPVPNVS